MARVPSIKPSFIAKDLAESTGRVTYEITTNHFVTVFLPIALELPESRSYTRLTAGAGWSSPVARQAHNLKVVGSNPTPATNASHPSG